MTLTGPARTLYVTDLDGTLLGEDGQLSAPSRQGLAALLADGVGLAVATARGPASTRRALDGVEPVLPAILYSGSTAVDGDGEALWWEHFDGRVVRPLIGAALAAGVAPLVFWRDGVEERISWVRGTETTEVDEFLYQREGDPRLAPVDGWDEIDSDRAFFVSVPGQAVPLRRLTRMIRAISWGRGCALAVTPGPDGSAMLDVTPDTATKGSGATRLAEHLGYERVVAFGDGANDLPLFEAADEAYAVGNATEAVQAAATAVIGTNVEDAVVAFITLHAARSRV